LGERILNRAIAGLKRIIARGNKFRYPESVKRATEEFIHHANPLPAFIADRCEREPKARCLMRDFYTEYCRWCEGQGITMTQQQATVRRNLGHLGFLVKHGNRGDTIYKLRLKSSFEKAWLTPVMHRCTKHPPPPATVCCGVVMI
jgi:putative DNA primase/helicase